MYTLEIRQHDILLFTKTERALSTIVEQLLKKIKEYDNHAYWHDTYGFSVSNIYRKYSQGYAYYEIGNYKIDIY